MKWLLFEKKAYRSNLPPAQIHLLLQSQVREKKNIFKFLFTPVVQGKLYEGLVYRDYFRVTRVWQNHGRMVTPVINGSYTKENEGTKIEMRFAPRTFSITLLLAWIAFCTLGLIWWLNDPEPKETETIRNMCIMTVGLLGLSVIFYIVFWREVRRSQKDLEQMLHLKEEAEK